MRREAALTDLCDDLQNQMHRNNLRIYQVPEESEKGDMAGFVKQLIKATLQLPPESNVHIERAHRSLGLKPDNTAPPRSIIVRFLDYSERSDATTSLDPETGPVTGKTQILRPSSLSGGTEEKNAGKWSYKAAEGEADSGRMSLPCAAESHLGDGSENFSNASRGSADSWGVRHHGAGE